MGVPPTVRFSPAVFIGKKKPMGPAAGAVLRYALPAWPNHGRVFIAATVVGG